MSGHTKEPWAINGNRIESSAEHGWANDGWIIAGLEGPDAEANARRIVAAVNACAGIPTDALEDGTARAERDALREMTGGTFYEIKKQRDELLAALERVIARPIGISTEVRNELQQAISSVKAQS